MMFQALVGCILKGVNVVLIFIQLISPTSLIAKTNKFVNLLQNYSN